MKLKREYAEDNCIREDLAGMLCSSNPPTNQSINNKNGRSKISQADLLYKMWWN